MVYDHVIFLHGLESSSQGFKAGLLRKLLPGIVTPDFRGALEERLAVLRLIITQRQCTVIGSSLGGLMAAQFAWEQPELVKRMILLAPALIWPDFATAVSQAAPGMIAAPTVIYHGRQDTVIPLEPMQAIASRVFEHLDLRVVDDDHRLQQTVLEIDWQRLVGQPDT